MSPTILVAQQPLREFLVDPILTVASVLLIVVSVGWIVIWRRILKDMRKVAAVRRRPPPGAVRPARDIWAYPP